MSRQIEPFAELIHDIRTGEAHQLLLRGAGHDGVRLNKYRPLSAEVLNADWALASFDLGQVSSFHARKPSASSIEVADRKHPFQAYALIFHLSYPDGFAGAFIMVVRAVNDGHLIEIFKRTSRYVPIDGRSYNWGRLAFSIMVVGNRCSIIFLPEIDEIARDSVRSEAEAFVNFWIRGLEVINTHPTVAEDLTPLLDSLNKRIMRKGRGRSKVKVPVPKTRVLLYDDRQCSPLQRGKGPSPLPHDRRGHWRHYKDAPRKWIKNMKILGGSSEAPRYRLHQELRATARQLSE